MALKKKGAPRAEVTGCSPDAVWHPGGHGNACSGGFRPFSGTAKDGGGGGAVDVEMEPVTQCHYRSFLVLRGERVNR